MKLVDDLDEDTPTLEEFEEMEVARIAGLRLFDVTRLNGTTKRIQAHWHDCLPSGVLYFITLQPDGSKLIHNSFSPRCFGELEEVFPFKGNCDGSVRIN